MNDQMQEKNWTPPAKIEELLEKLQPNFNSLNSSTSGARIQKALPVGRAPIQLYSDATPNGNKVSIMLEELQVEYDAHTINLKEGEQFTSGFVEINPNSKIPALIDKEGPEGKPIYLFESAAIVLYLAEKYGKYLPKDPSLKYQVYNWIFWQMGGLGPTVGQLGHFLYSVPPNLTEAKDYGVARYGMETQRLLHVLETHLKGREFMVGDEFTIADIIVFPWANSLRNGTDHPSGINAKNFLSIEQNYPSVVAWVDRMNERHGFQRGLMVNKVDGPGKPWLNPNKDEAVST